MTAIGFEEYVRKEDDFCDTFGTPHYKFNCYESFGAHCIAPLKNLLAIDIQNESYLYQLAIAIAKAIVTPLALFGAYLKQKGEKINPGFQFREQIAQKKIELWSCYSQQKSPLGFITEGLEVASRFLNINTKLRDHLKEDEGSENYQAATIILKMMTTPLIGSIFLNSFLETNPELKNVPVVQRWFSPFFNLVDKLKTYKEGDLLDVMQELESICTFAKEVAPADTEWHQEIENHFRAEQTRVVMGRPLLNRINAACTTLQNLMNQLEGAYAVPV